MNESGKIWLRKHDACSEAVEWAEQYATLAEAFDACEELDWLIWAVERIGGQDKALRLFACDCVRDVWHLLTDERSRKAVEVAEAFAVGDASVEELAAAAWAAWAAKPAAAAAAADAAWDAAAARAADAAAARDADAGAARDADAARAADWAAAADAATDAAATDAAAARAADADAATDAAARAAWDAAAARAADADAATDAAAAADAADAAAKAKQLEHFRARVRNPFRERIGRRLILQQRLG